MPFTNVQYNNDSPVPGSSRTIRRSALAAAVLGAATISSIATALLFSGSPRSLRLACDTQTSAVSSVRDQDVHEGTVTRVLHGDTLLLNGVTKVRLIGVDTLSPFDPRAAVAACGEASRSFVASLVENQHVRLEYEGPHFDDFGRIRAHVYLLDGRLLSAEMVRAGYAIARGKLQSRLDPMLRDLDVSARATKVGLWRETPPWSETNTADALESTRVEQPASWERPSAPSAYEPAETRVDVATTARAGSYATTTVAASIGGSLPIAPSYRVATLPAAPARSSVAENGSYYGEISTATGRPKSVYVSGYTRQDGTFVRSHYRSRPQ